jgi:hypothetical protein
VYKTDLLIDAMGKFNLEPAKPSVLTGKNTAVQFTGEKRSLQQDPRFFLKIGPFQKFGVSPS